MAAEPRLLPTFLQVLALVPRTIAELVAELALRVKKQSAHPQIPSDHPKGTHQSGSNTQSPLPEGHRCVPLSQAHAVLAKSPVRLKINLPTALPVSE